jgi:hypothetical protein
MVTSEKFRLCQDISGLFNLLPFTSGYVKLGQVYSVYFRLVKDRSGKFMLSVKTGEFWLSACTSVVKFSSSYVR